MPNSESNNTEGKPRRSVQDNNDESDALTSEIGALSEDVQNLSNDRQKVIDRRRVVEQEGEDTWNKMNETDPDADAPVNQNYAV